MTRSFQVQPLSLLIGFGLAAIVFVSMSQVSAYPVQLANARCEVMPHPRDFVRIEQDTPYQVPQGRLLVLTAVGVTGLVGSPTPSVKVEIDGIEEMSARLPSNSLDPSVTMGAIPEGFVIHGGSTIALINSLGPNFARAWGYLADA